MYKYPYLNDAAFLQSFLEEHIIEQFVKIIVLNHHEKPIQEIQGRVTGGSLNFDGNSAIRRTGNLSMYVENRTNDLTDVKHLFSINKRVSIEIGFKNFTSSYHNYDMLWFPLGTYIIANPSISHGTGGVNISLSLKDKMCLLNGENGGVIPAAVTFHEYEELDPTTGEYIVQKPTIIQIIRELVNHFGGEQLGKIIISDLDTRVKKVMKWTGSSPLYLYQNQSSYQFTLGDPPGDGWTLVPNGMFEKGEDVGFIYSDFYYPGELSVNAGSSVCDVLDQIKNTLGNFEYFYDVYGNFIFQEIKNYLNNSKSTVDLNNINNSNYLVNRNLGNSVFAFNNNKITTSFSNNPQYNMIKNDFVVWGTRKGVTGNSIPIRYHLSIDKKPSIGNDYFCFFYIDPDDNIKKAKVAIDYENFNAFPEIGNIDRFYYDKANNKIYKYIGKKNKDDKKDEIYVALDVEVKKITTTDWRTELYLSGVRTERFGTDSNYYYSELVNEWPKIYDVEAGNFYPDVQLTPSDIDFYLDFIDSNAAISELSVSNIGRRTKVINDSKINCVFEPYIPDFVIIPIGKNDNDSMISSDLRAECEQRGQNYIQVNTDIYEKLSPGGSKNSAFNMIKDLLYQYTNYNETVSVQSLPAYFLEPNTRITIKDLGSGVNGDYMINSISLPLDTNGTMTLSCVKALERI